MAGSLEWVLLAYRLPREPSTTRVSVWRQLRRCGAVFLVDGLAALPADGRTREQLDWIAEEVVTGGGEATIWVGRLASVASERVLAARMAASIAAEYEATAAAAVAALSDPPSARTRMVVRLRRELRRIRQRDFFPPPARDSASQAVDALRQSVEVGA
jgi:hypothetical protein